MRLRIRLAVAPRHLFHALWKPNTPADQRDDTRRDLVEFITQGWDSLDIEATPTHDNTRHTVPPASPIEQGR